MDFFGLIREAVRFWAGVRGGGTSSKSDSDRRIDWEVLGYGTLLIKGWWIKIKDSVSV